MFLRVDLNARLRSTLQLFASLRCQNYQSILRINLRRIGRLQRAFNFRRDCIRHNVSYSSSFNSVVNTSNGFEILNYFIDYGVLTLTTGSFPVDNRRQLIGSALDVVVDDDVIKTRELSQFLGRVLQPQG